MAWVSSNYRHDHTLLAIRVIGGGADQLLLCELRLRYLRRVSDQIVVDWLTNAVQFIDAGWGNDESDGTTLYAAVQISGLGITTEALAMGGCSGGASG